ncbi:MAG: C-GCAxxG-C-C family protein [Clostridiales bacterium]|nr:C-GCAxxG-C-C family protein [Clostridiales bacterium]
MTDREKQATAYFEEGCNCAQAVLMTYADLLGLTPEQAAMVSVGHGGGMGRLRLHCGAFSAAVMLAGALEGPEGAEKEHRPETYARVQEIHRRFMEINGTISCAELLGRAGVPENPTPEERTPEYYAKRPCARIIRSACQIIDDMLAEQETPDA